MCSSDLPCGKCNVCRYTQISKTIDLGLPYLWEQRSFTNCNSKQVIYMITCPCSLRYIGMTNRPAKIRIQEHRSSIRCKRITTKLITHYSEYRHTADDIKWTIIEQVMTSPMKIEQKLFEKEQRWVYRLSTNTKGLKDDIPWHHINLT